MKDHNRNTMPELEMWGGVECTINRVGNRYLDQIVRNGHDSRPQDLELFAGLGIEAIRYPILWERIAESSLNQCDWSWSDERMNMLRELGIRPIVGLIHHGSGPRYTSLVDPKFPEKLARYARSVAERYPWVEDYTPVNEPLTTARFSGLYGLWYPHAKDSRVFGQALLNQCVGTALAMREIRRVNPSARLVQTEDLGKTWSTPHLAYQAAFENERRWLSLDILCGRFHEGHTLWQYLELFGLEDSLELLSQAVCSPDIIGINHYITSERFLDERIDRYPESCHGGNLTERYADVEAVRASQSGLAGPKTLLRQAWKRYGIPIAVTECHLGCTREEQMRWLSEVWHAAQQLHTEHVDIRAVTAWSLLGTYDWDTMLTQQNDHYEPGVYDMRGANGPRETALADMVRSFATKGEYHHPLLAVPGWWKRTERLVYFSDDLQHYTDTDHRPQTTTKNSSAAPILITGATGTLGSALARICTERSIPFRLLTRQDMDITNTSSVESALDQHKPWAIVNTAGYVRVDDAEYEPDICRQINAKAPEMLAKVCERDGVSFVTISSDLVFDGSSREPYVESDTPKPLNVYGKTKLESERLVLDVLSSALVIRTSAFFGPWDSYNFLTTTLAALSKGMKRSATVDSTISPTYVPDLAHTILDLLIDGADGIWHAANRGSMTWLEFGREAAQRLGLDANLIQPCSTDDLGLPARRPAYSVLSSEKAWIMPTLDSALDRYLDEVILSKDQAATPLLSACGVAAGDQ